VWQVQGSYDYYHYMQDRIDDSVSACRPPRLIPSHPCNTVPCTDTRFRHAETRLVPAPCTNRCPGSVLHAASCAGGVLLSVAAPIAVSDPAPLLRLSLLLWVVPPQGWGCAYRSLQTIISWFREPAVHPGGGPEPQVCPHAPQRVPGQSQSTKRGSQVPSRGVFAGTPMVERSQLVASQPASCSLLPASQPACWMCLRRGGAYWGDSIHAGPGG